MWFKHKAWIPVSWVLCVANLVSVWVAVRPDEPPVHATTHALLAILFALGAQHLRNRRSSGSHGPAGY